MAALFYYFIIVKLCVTSMHCFFIIELDNSQYNYLKLAAFAQPYCQNFMLL
jgi:hypothetical protein